MENVEKNQQKDNLKEIKEDGLIVQEGNFKKKVPTKKQEMFIHEYLVNGFKPCEAYLKVYSNVKRSTAMTEGPALLKKPQVQEFMAPLLQELSEKEYIKKSEVVQTLKDLIVKCLNDDDRKNLLKAIEQLSKIGGLYQLPPTVALNVSAPEASGNINISFGGWNPDQATTMNIETIDITDIEDGVPLVEKSKNEEDL